MITSVYPTFEMILLRFRENLKPDKDNPITYLSYVPDATEELEQNVPFVEKERQTKDSIIVLLDSKSSPPSPYHRCTFKLTGVQGRNVYLANYISEKEDDVVFLIKKSRLNIYVNDKKVFNAFYSTIATLQLKSFFVSNICSEKTRTIFVGFEVSVDEIDRVADLLLKKLLTQKSMAKTTLKKLLNA